MKLFKTLAMLGTFIGIMTLSSCNFQRDLNTFWDHYTLEARSMNYLFANNSRETQFVGNFIDGLMETDQWGNLVPALADDEGYTIDTTGENYTFTFNIRQGNNGPLQWVDHTGTPRANIVADDWVAAAEWILNPFNSSENLNIWIQLIYGVDDFVAETVRLQGEIVRHRENLGWVHPTTQSFVAKFDAMFYNISNHIGIEAIDANTLVFTTNGRLPFFPGSLTANAFFPVSRQLLEQRSGLFGQTYRHIWYSGGFRAVRHARWNFIEKVANEHYWDYENVHIQRIHMRFIQATDPSMTRLLFENNELDEFYVNMNDTAAVSRYVLGPEGEAGGHNVFNPYYHGAFSRQDEGEFMRPGTFNFTRGLSNFANPANHTPASLANTQKALTFTSFRQAFVFSIDWVDWVNRRFPDSVNGYDWRNTTWTLPGLASAPIPSGLANADEVADAAGRVDYSWFFARQFMVSNPELNLGNVDDAADIERVRLQLIAGSIQDGNVDHVYNEENSEDTVLRAFRELRDAGITFPIIIETPTPEAAVNHNAIMELANGTEETRGIADYWSEIIREYEDVASNFRFVEFRAVRASGGNWPAITAGHFDFKFPNNGWGATVGDPIQYAAVFNLSGGAWLERMGVSPRPLGQLSDELSERLLGRYSDMVDIANAETSNMTKRFELFAEAEHHLLFEEAVVVPGVLDARTRVVVSRILPFTQTRDSLGIAHRKHKHRVLIPANVTVNAEQAQLLYQAWLLEDVEALNTAITTVISQIQVRG